MSKRLCVYLNAGIGIPCAGQVIATPDPSCFLNADESRIEENFGLENPNGSKETNQKAPILFI